MHIKSNNYINSFHGYFKFIVTVCLNVTCMLKFGSSERKNRDKVLSFEAPAFCLLNRHKSERKNHTVRITQKGKTKAIYCYY